MKTMAFFTGAGAGGGGAAGRRFSNARSASLQLEQ